MQIRDLESMGCVLVQPEHTGSEILNGYTSDLLSDVMAHAGAGSVLITIQAHTNTVAVATLLDLPAIIICNGKTVEADMLDAARQEKIAIFTTNDDQFTTSSKVYQKLHQ